MDSDDNSTHTAYHTISHFNNSDIETPDEFENSKPSLSTFWQPPFRPLHTPTPDETYPDPFSYTDATPILSPMTSDPHDLHRPVDEELENELDNFITLEQQVQKPNTLTIHHLSQTITSSVSSNLASTTKETRVHRVFKRKPPNASQPPTSSNAFRSSNSQ